MCKCEEELNADRVRDRAAGWRPAPEPRAGGGGGLVVVGAGSDSRAAVMQCGEGDDGDGEVESSLRGPWTPWTRSRTHCPSTGEPKRSNPLKSSFLDPSSSCNRVRFSS